VNAEALSGKDGLQFYWHLINPEGWREWNSWARDLYDATSAIMMTRCFTNRMISYPTKTAAVAGRDGGRGVHLIAVFVGTVSMNHTQMNEAEPSSC
jgi:hypothetical protein